jgi:hypothetical protein
LYEKIESLECDVEEDGKLIEKLHDELYRVKEKINNEHGIR